MIRLNRFNRCVYRVRHASGSVYGYAIFEFTNSYDYYYYYCYYRYYWYAYAHYAYSYTDTYYNIIIMAGNYMTRADIGTDLQHIYGY